MRAPETAAIPPGAPLTGSELRDFREEQGLRRDMFARLLGVGYDAVVSWETGRRPVPPTVEVLVALWEQVPWLRQLLEAIADDYEAVMRPPNTGKPT